MHCPAPPINTTMTVDRVQRPPLNALEARFGLRG